MSWYFQCQTWAAILGQIKKKKKNVPKGGEIQIDRVLRFGGRSEPKLSGRFLACAMTKSPMGGGGVFSDAQLKAGVRPDITFIIKQQMFSGFEPVLISFRGDLGDE